MICPDDQTWATYLRGDMPDARASELREHLDTCAPCRARVAKASREPASQRGMPEPVISFKEPDPANTAVTVRPGGDEPPTPALTLVPSGEDES